MAIVLFSDSLAFPRTEPEVVKLESTYFSIIKKKLDVDVLLCGVGGGTSQTVAKQLPYLGGDGSNFDVHIFHFGIVDCTPRVLTHREARILSLLGIRLPSSSTRVLRRIRTVRDIKPNVFRKNCEIIKHYNLKNTVVLSIAPASDDFESVVPNIKKSIKVYNDILKEVFGNDYLDIDLDADLHLMTDYHHLNCAGHKLVADAIVCRIKRILNTSTW